MEINLNPIKHSKNVFAATSSSFKAKSLQENTQQIYNLLNKPFEKKYGISFAENMTNLNELNIEKKSTKYQKQKEKRRIVKQVKKPSKKDWESDVVERFVLYIYQLRGRGGGGGSINYICSEGGGAYTLYKTTTCKKRRRPKNFQF